ncbi:RNA polymerase sigma factor [candidate division KSB1 bacterium]|nr:RNA polymerase sigma factor [candidate division KSB1 bacterium]
MNTLSDNQLASEIKRSNKQAFETFYFRYYKLLFHYIISRIQCSETAKEIIQDIFKRLWQNRNNINTRKSIKAYLFRIANNLLIDSYRKKRVQNSYFDRPEEPPEIVSGENLDFKTQFHIAMEKLPEGCRVVFTLHHVKNYTYLEIAEMCSVSKKTVEKRMKLALGMLREQLG